MRYQGKLKKWNVQRGFGFIVADEGGQDIFVHASAFARDSILPTEGETLSFEVEPDRDGKKKAVRVTRPNVQSVARASVSRNARFTKSAPQSTGFGKLILLLILVSFGWYAYSRYTQRVAQLQTEQAAPEVVDSVPARAGVDESIPVTQPIQIPVKRLPSASLDFNTSAPPSFQCDGRLHCSQMKSCKEAKYFLANCPGVKMDGDHDGVPCEEQWCTSPFAE